MQRRRYQREHQLPGTCILTGKFYESMKVIQDLVDQIRPQVRARSANDVKDEGRYYHGCLSAVAPYEASAVDVAAADAPIDRPLLSSSVLEEKTSDTEVPPCVANRSQRTNFRMHIQ